MTKDDGPYLSCKAWGFLTQNNGRNMSGFSLFVLHKKWPLWLSFCFQVHSGVRKRLRNLLTRGVPFKRKRQER